MATRAEEFRSQAVKLGKQAKTKPSKRKPKKSEWRRESAHAASKASHALEPTAPGKRPSRESTRASANRAKSDTAFNLTEQKSKNSPENRARRARAKTVRVRGS